MKSKKVLLSAAFIVLLLVVVSCNKQQATTAPQTENTVTNQEPASSPTEKPSSEVSEPKGPPEDVPIMPEGYDLKVVNPLNLTYKVDLPAEDVLKYYQDELPNYGWEITKNPDSSVGATSQMTRENSKGDKINTTMQYNPVGKFTIVQIYINRVP